MTSVVKNGQPSMEEILASIRRIVADDPSGVSPLIDLNRKPLDRNAPQGGDGVGADDSPDFELPNMFRQDGGARTGAKAKTAPIGRLTDAIRNVGPKVVAVGNGRLKTHSQASQPLAGQTAQQKNGGQDLGGFGIRPKPTQSLSSLTAKRGADEPAGTDNGAPVQNGAHPGETPITNGPAGAATAQSNGTRPHLNVVHDSVQSEPIENSFGSGQTQSAPDARASAFPAQLNQGANQEHGATSSAASQDVSSKNTAVAPPRVMAPFRDTRMSRMAPASGAKPAVQPQTEASQSGVAASVSTESESTAPGSRIGAIVPGALDLPGRGPAATDATNGAPSGIVETSSNQQAAAAPNQGADLEANPPPLPDGSESSPPQHIEDATADLLRPMLRQWLSDNMPRMVEKALHIEVAETVRTGKPPESS